MKHNPTMLRVLGSALLFGLSLVGEVYASSVSNLAARDTTLSDSSVLNSIQVNITGLSLEGLDAQLQTCPIIATLNAERASHAHPPSALESIFHILFPGSPAVNAILATLYISGPPNLLLALCPTDIDPSALKVMVAFAVGGLMGDTLFHLLPEIFLGEEDNDRVKMVLVEPKRNLLLGVAILVGFMTFVAMDKAVRIATGGGSGHDHSHGHSHARTNGDGKAEGSSTSVATVEATTQRRTKKLAAAEGSIDEDGHRDQDHFEKEVKIGGYLNMIADFTHNITDGLAMSASFYASPTIGATTTVAVFFHEIPHELCDFALLVQSGFTKWQAMAAQFATAGGALLGTMIGIAIQEFGSGESGERDRMPMDAGLMGTSLTWGDMLLPFTAGTFLYVATVSVIPELLETSKEPGEVRRAATQLSAVMVGAGVMVWISWH